MEDCNAAAGYQDASRAATKGLLLSLLGVRLPFLLVSGDEKLNEQNQQTQIEDAIEYESFSSSTAPFISFAYELVPEEGGKAQETADTN